MYSVIKGIRIAAVATGVPNKWLSLKEQFVYKDSIFDEKTIKKFEKNTGIEGRYVSNIKQTNSDWCYAAAEKILSLKNIDRNQIGVIVYITQTADYREPATAMVLQHRLHVGKDCLVFDINLGCSGYVYGLNIVGCLMQLNKIKYGLLLCGETGSREKIPSDNSLTNTEQMIFGDAGSATLLTLDQNAPDMKFMLKSDGNGFKIIIDPWEFYRNPIKLRNVGVMDGLEVFNFSTNIVPDLINDLMNKIHTTSKDYDYLVLHQAHKLIMRQIEKRTGFPEEKSIKSIDKFGNTSSASIPTALVHNLADKEGMSHFLLCGFGIGLSWGALDCYINKSDILPLVKTDEYFEDGYQSE